MFKTIFVVICYFSRLGQSVAIEDDRQWSPRILNGVRTDVSKVPYIVSIIKSREHVCGGSIISKDFVLTAAHCIANNIVKSHGIMIRAGSSNRMHGGVIIEVKSYSIHPLYDKISLSFDAGILLLKKPLKFGRTIQKIPLINSRYKLPFNEKVLVSGWGIEKSGRFPRMLHSANITLYTIDVCRKAYPNNITPHNMICAGDIYDGKDSCLGDSGGPMSYKNSLIGIVSWGRKCGVPQYPGVYTNVAIIKDWILVEMNKMLRFENNKAELIPI